MSLPLQISHISKQFDKKLVLDDVNLDVKQGDIFGFIGLNGAGKTTLIKIILDLLDENEGKISIFGVDKNLPESRRNICYLPEKFQPSSNLKGMEFIQFVLDFHKEEPTQAQIKKICLNLDLPFEVLSKRVTKYSKGMTQKLGLIAVFLSKANLIILDEPMSGLDPKARIQLKKQLLEYKKQGKTIFFSSHILSDMDEICDEIAVLNGSKITFKGKASDFKAKYDESSLDRAFLKEIGEI